MLQKKLKLIEFPSLHDPLFYMANLTLPYKLYNRILKRIFLSDESQYRNPNKPLMKN